VSVLRAKASARHLPHSQGLTRALLAGGVVGPVLFIVVFLMEDATRPGYRPSQDMVSALSLSNQGWEQIANFLICGVCLLIFAFGLQQTSRTGIGRVWGPVLMGIFGLSLIIAGIFSTDPAAGYPPGASAVQTLHGTIHGLNAPIAFGSLTAAIFVLGRRFLHDRASRTWGWYSLVTGIVLVLSFIASLTLAALAKSGALPSAPAGFLERVAIIVGWAWVALVALRLLGQDREVVTR
jgi:hypothetical protein